MYLFYIFYIYIYIFIFIFYFLHISQEYKSLILCTSIPLVSKLLWLNWTVWIPYHASTLTDPPSLVNTHKSLNIKPAMYSNAVGNPLLTDLSLTWVAVSLATHWDKLSIKCVLSEDKCRLTRAAFMGGQCAGKTDVVYRRFSIPFIQFPGSVGCID